MIAFLLYIHNPNTYQLNMNKKLANLLYKIYFQLFLVKLLQIFELLFHYFLSIQ